MLYKNERKRKEENCSNLTWWTRWNGELNGSQVGYCWSLSAWINEAKRDNEITSAALHAFRREKTNQKAGAAQRERERRPPWKEKTKQKIEELEVIEIYIYYGIIIVCGGRWKWREDKKRPVDDSCGTERERDQLWPTFLLSFLIAMLCHALLAVRPSLIRQRVWRELTTFTRFRFFVFCLCHKFQIYLTKKKKKIQRKEKENQIGIWCFPLITLDGYIARSYYTTRRRPIALVFSFDCVCAPVAPSLFSPFFFIRFLWTFGARLYHEFHIGSFAERYSSNGDERRISLWKRFWF